MYDVDVVGAEGRGFLWPAFGEDDDDDDYEDMLASPRPFGATPTTLSAKDASVGSEEASGDLEAFALPASAAARRKPYMFTDGREERRQAFTMGTHPHTLIHEVYACD